MLKTGQFREKPETGQNLSGKKFALGTYILLIDFTYALIFSISGAIKKLLNLVFTESQELSSC